MQNHNNIRYSTAPLDGMRILSCCGNHNFSKHLHDGYVLWLNSNAGEYYSLQGSSFLLQPGSISIIEPGVIHANYSKDQDTSHLRSFYLSEKCLQDFSNKLKEKNKKQILPTTEIKDKRLWQRFISLHDRMLLAGEKLEVECTLLTVFADLFKRLRHFDLPPIISEGSRLTKIKDYMYAHLAENISLDDLAQEVGCTAFHLIRIFRREMNTTPHAYLVQLRLERARHLLDQGKSIVDAAFLSGFADQCHLTRKFKTRYGITPGRYLFQCNRRPHLR